MGAPRPAAYAQAQATPTQAATPAPSTSLTGSGPFSATPPPGATPFFTLPVESSLPISSYFDHNPAARQVLFFDGRRNAASSGFLFTCPGVGNGWVACTSTASSEQACPLGNQLWYDEHHGIDFEFVDAWSTGSQCQRAQFAGITHAVYAAAAGYVGDVGKSLYNGNYVVLYHDLNGDGNYFNDGLRSWYLHFAENGIQVEQGDIVKQGQLLGDGDMTGLAWTPHLHFQVDRRTSNGWQPVDPFGWAAAGDDPWSYGGAYLWEAGLP